MSSACLMSSPTRLPQARTTTPWRLLKDSSGHLRPPAYLLIALVTAVATVVLLTAVMLVLPG
jgi:hypothetical protein